MRRKLFNFVAMVSLVLCLVTVVLWVRSEKYVSAIFYSQYGIHVSVALLESGIEVNREGHWSSDESTASVETFDDDMRHLLTGNGSPTMIIYLFSRAAVLRIPLWSVGFVELVLPLIWVTRRATTRRRKGHCPQCFYDLTGNVSGVCPECGTAVAGKAGT